MKTKILEIKCRFCGAVGGTIEVADHRAEYESQMKYHTEMIGNLSRPFDQAKMSPTELEEEHARRAAQKKYHADSHDSFKSMLSKLPPTDPRHSADFHVEDHRCDPCEASHGNYKEMVHTVMAHGLSHEYAKKVMEKTGFKKHGLLEAIAHVKKSNI